MIQETRQIGSVPWSRADIIAALPEFLEVYRQRPIRSNEGGMKAPHLFASWFMLRTLRPSTVIESGVWKGQGTWLIEQALPDARIFSIDVNPRFREYHSERARYFDKDFSQIDWSVVEDREDALLFFDDHQNAFERIKQGRSLGFKTFVFEDNYAAPFGDCYSLKKAFQHAGFRPALVGSDPLYLLKQLVVLPGRKRIRPNGEDATYLREVLAAYYEFPPVFKSETTRTGDAWTDEKYPTPPPLLTELEDDALRVFRDEAADYTWICLAVLK